MRGRVRMIALGGLVALIAAAPARASGIVGGYRLVDLGPLNNGIPDFYPSIDDAGKIGPFNFPDSGAYSFERTYQSPGVGIVVETHLLKAGSGENLLPPSMSGPVYQYGHVNATGHVTGTRYDGAGGNTIDFHYEPETGRLLEPKAFPGADYKPQILGLNNLDQMVGAQGGLALFYEDPAAEPIELGKLLGTDSGWLLRRASGINNRGEIVGYGVNPDNRVSTFKLEPVPEPSSLALFASLALAALRFGPWARGALGTR